MDDKYMDVKIEYNPNKKSNVIASCSENQFTSHDLCEENHERELETTVKALLGYIEMLHKGF
jgi:hypothetical protein